MDGKQPMRIGDAERNAAATALGEHYAAGRLTKDEYDERADRIWAARFQDDLEPVFADLPGAGGSRPQEMSASFAPPRPMAARDDRWSAHRSGRVPACTGRGGPGSAGLLMVAAIVVLVVMADRGAPWVLFLLPLLWIAGGVRFHRTRSVRRPAMAYVHGGRRS